jgi:hypothetical protein
MLCHDFTKFLLCLAIFLQIDAPLPVQLGVFLYTDVFYCIRHVTRDVGEV